MYDCCADAFHRARRDCPSAGPGREACLKAMGILSSPSHQPEELRCRASGDSAERFIRSTDPSAWGRLEIVHGVPLRGAPTRLARPASSSSSS